MITNAEIKKIQSEARNLATTINPNELLREMAKDKHNYIEDKTNADIFNEIHQSVTEEYGKNASKIIKRLVGYRHVDELDALHIGQFTRWIQKYQDNIKLSNGGFLVNVIFTDEGVNLAIKMWNGVIMQIRFDECLIYQKLSFGEQIILMASDHVNG
jgi:hypothetical protein